MSEKRSTKTTLLIGLMMFALFSPILNSASAVEESDNHPKSDEPKGVIHGDLRDFNPSEGRQYLLFDEEKPIVSAYGFMKQAWIDAGMPGQRIDQPQRARPQRPHQ